MAGSSFALQVVLDLRDNLTAGLDRIRDTLRPVQQAAAEVQESFSGMTNAAKNVGKSIAGIGASIAAQSAVFAGVAGGVYSFAKAQADIGDTLATNAAKIGITTDAWSALVFAGDKLDVSARDLETGMTRLNKAIYAAANGDKKLAAIFEENSIAIEDADGKMRSANEVLLDLADAFSKEEDKTKAAAIAMEIFGRSGANMLPMLYSGSEAIQEQCDLAAQLGKVWTDEAGAAANDFNNELIDLYGVFEGIQQTIAKELFPVLGDTARALREILVDILGRFKAGEFREQIQEIGRTVSGIVRELPGRIEGVITSVNNVVQSFGGWKSVITMLASAFAGLKFAGLIVNIISLGKATIESGIAIAKAANAMIPAITSVATSLKGVFLSGVTAATGALKALWAAMLANPITAIIAAVAALGAAVYLIYDNWDTVGPWLSEKWESIKAIFTGALDGIVSCVSDKIAAVREAFSEGILKGIGAILKEFNPVSMIYDQLNSIVKTVAGFSLADAGSRLLSSLWDGMKAAWDKMTGWIGGIVDSVGSVWSGIAGLFSWGGGDTPKQQQDQSAYPAHAAQALPLAQATSAIGNPAEILRNAGNAGTDSGIGAGSGGTPAPIHIYLHSTGGERVDVENPNSGIDFILDGAYSGRRSVVGAY